MRFIIAFILFSALFSLALPALATPEHAKDTGQGCMVCHIRPRGGTLNQKGLEYAASGYRWPPRGGFRILGPIRKPVSFFVGLLHMFAGFMWFGTILYVHLLLRPGYASKGLPRGEVFLGLISMAVVGVTGILLTVSKINGLDVLYQSRWGLLLSLKILFYLVMVTSALIAVFIVGPKLRKRKKTPGRPADGVFDPLTLSGFDGHDGRPAYIAFRNKIFDATGSSLWKDGSHMRQHSAGRDLTEALERAPHGAEKVEALKAVGSYDSLHRPAKTPAQKAFYFVAYMNLSIVFAVIFILAMWRWGI